MLPQISGHSTFCLTGYVGLHERNITVRIIDPLWGEFTCDREIPRTKGQ